MLGYHWSTSEESQHTNNGKTGSLVQSNHWNEKEQAEPDHKGVKDYETFLTRESGNDEVCDNSMNTQKHICEEFYDTGGDHVVPVEIPDFIQSVVRTKIVEGRSEFNHQ